MNEALSPNTTAILLLTAPLLVGRGAARDPTPRPLSPKRDYNALARRLREIRREPADLLCPDAADVLDECQAAADFRLDRQRIESLLGRGIQFSLAVERWRTRAIWVLSRADEEYPRRLKLSLGAAAPPVLYGCGDRSFLDGGGLAVVGPRDAGEGLLAYAREVGELAADAGRTIVSGGAKGTDRAGMEGALSAGGRAIGVLAGDLARAATQRENRDLLLDGRLALISAYDPAARFLVGHAMERNHSIYSLADASLVVEALPGRGGTWAGAAAQLKRRSDSPVYVRSHSGRSEGLAELEALGALPWPDPQAPGAFGLALKRRAAATPAPGAQRPLIAASVPLNTDPQR